MFPSALKNGACIDLPEEQKEWFFGHECAKAKKICHTCPVKDECLDDVLRWEEPGELRFGVRGGLSADKRRQLYG